MRPVPLGSRLDEPKLLNKISWRPEPLLPNGLETGCLRSIYAKSSVLAPIDLAPTAAQMLPSTPMLWIMHSPFFRTAMATIALEMFNSLGNLSGLICHYVMSLITELSRSSRASLHVMSDVLFVSDIAAFFVSSSILRIHKNHAHQIFPKNVPRMPYSALVATQS
ncbi:hypothetical protein [Pseudomonas congelans]|uniref:hypothetical protein n=1 Tax=Pseudomonas congelans TaxID=200452 RepID=UPI0016554DDB|nr:hypothetical protein [Pseudomonas congelans]MBC8802640.1 hypothetical protein [Pseudomonas congelans]